jgi:uncharacterized protein
MIKIILDTNVLISALIFSGQPSIVLKKCFEDYNIQLYSSKAIYEEIKDKIENGRVDKIAHKVKVFLTKENKTEFLDILKSQCHFYTPKKQFKTCRDPKDDMFLDLAIEVGADFIITGDKDLLEISSFYGTKILKPKEFLDLYF